jgi:hypothetical protein
MLGSAAVWAMEVKNASARFSPASARSRACHVVRLAEIGLFGALATAPLGPLASARDDIDVAGERADLVTVDGLRARQVAKHRDQIGTSAAVASPSASIISTPPTCARLDASHSRISVAGVIG